MTPTERQKIDLQLARFAEAMSAWNFSRTTIRSYTYLLRVFTDWIERETDVHNLAHISAGTIAAYQVALLSAETPSAGRLAVSTQHLRLCAVKALFRWLAREGKLLIDPAALIPLPKRRSALPQALLSPKEAIRLLEATGTTSVLGARDRAILEVLYATGMRNAEIRALTLGEFDSSGTTLLIRHGKGGKDRVVPLGPLAADVLTHYIAGARLQLARRGQPSQTIFLSNKGTPLSDDALRAVVVRAAARAGIAKHIRPHRLRHACATHMLKGGADIRHIQKLLGHASLESTQVYTRVEISDLKAVHKKFHPRERGRK